MDCRRSERFTRFDGNLAGLSVPSPADQVTSATRLELWASCPFAYLLQNVLQVEEVENPEDQLQISPRDRGSLVHQALEQFIDEVLARRPDDIPGPSEPWSEPTGFACCEIGEKWCAWYEARGLTGRAIFWQRDKKHILADLGRFLRADSLHRSDDRHSADRGRVGFRSSGSPSSESSPCSSPMVETSTSEAKPIVSTAADRRDGPCPRLQDRCLPGLQDLSEGNPDAEGRKLQLAVYGQAARQFVGDPAAPVLAEYWFVSTKGRFDGSDTS